MNYLKAKQSAETLLRMERSAPRVVAGRNARPLAVRAPQALWPLTLGFTLFSLWIAIGLLP